MCEKSDLIGEDSVRSREKRTSQIHRWRQFAGYSFRGNKADRREPSQGKSIRRTAAKTGTLQELPIFLPAESVCQAFGLVCGIRFAGMAPCGPLYSLRSVCRKQDLARSRPFGVGEPMRHSPYRACKIKSEFLQLTPILRPRLSDYLAGCNRAISRR
jgi:hypothetical protein